MAHLRDCFLCLLLCVSIITVHAGREWDPESVDPCTHGLTLIQFFTFDCARPIQRNVTGSDQILRGNIATVAGMTRALTEYCGTIMPAARQCFAERIRGCTAQQQVHLNRLASQTSFFCKEGSDTINPAISQVLSALTDEDVPGNSPCEIASFDCHNEAIASIGVTYNDQSLLHNADIDQLVPLLQTYIQTLARCVLRSFRATSTTCRQWRGAAILFWGSDDMIRGELLGVRMPFSPDEAQTEFQTGNNLLNRSGRKHAY